MRADRPNKAPEDTRAALLAAARDLLVAEGLSGLSMRRVASACGLSATAIYRHFDDKDALVSAAAVEGFRIFGAYLRGALERATPAARFRGICQRYFDFARDHPRDYQLIFLTNCAELGMEQLDETSRKEVSGTFQMLVDRIAECQMAQLFRPGDARADAVFVWSALHGICALLLTGNLDSEPEALVPLLSAQLTAIERALSPRAQDP